jgi:VWFA-related protein
MRTFAALLLALALSLPFLSPVRAQTTAAQDEDVVRVGSREVKLDVVVKDKRGRPVKDLKETDFQVYEDGKPQRIESFRFVSREAMAPSSPAGEKVAPGPEAPAAPPRRTTPGVTALVFDRLSPDARNLARKAGTAYAQDGMAGGDFTGVFTIDQTLRTLQSFTDNAELVRAAIERAVGVASSSSNIAADSATGRTQSDRVIALNNELTSAQSGAPITGPGGTPPADGAVIGPASVELKFAEMETAMREQYQELERDQMGFATINALLAVINPMKRLPGRKTLIFFSEGLSLPPAVAAKFPAVISAANKANVTIYAIDSAGLRTESGISEAARELNSMVGTRMAQAGRGNDAGTNGPYMKALEKNETMLRLDSRGNLGMLASETGGFLIHDTNDLASGLRRINDDMSGYYMLTYVPQNTEYDGRFRQISVKLGKQNYDVQARKGYYAVESVGDFAVLDYEAPALAAALHARAGQNPFPFRAGALSYPAPGRPGLALVLAEAPLSAFNFSTSEDKKSYSADFTILSLVKDGSGQVVQKLSQHYPLSGPADKLDAARKEELLFYRETLLAPGSYTVETVAYDATSGKSAVTAGRLDIPGADETRPRLSSVSVLKRGERLTAEEQKANRPFQFGELLVYPNLGEPLRKSASPQLAFFFTAWPAKDSAAPLRMTLEILREGHSLGQTSGQLPAPDAQGQIKYASSFPLDKFQPGLYELKVTVGDGRASVSRSTGFAVAP